MLEFLPISKYDYEHIVLLLKKKGASVFQNKFIKKSAQGHDRHQNDQNSLQTTKEIIINR